MSRSLYSSYNERKALKNLFSATSLLVTDILNGYQITPKKCKKDKKHMTTNTHHTYDPYSFIILSLTLFSPMYQSPRSYKNVVNRSKKAFLNYLPVSNKRTIRLRLTLRREIVEYTPCPGMKLYRSKIENQGKYLAISYMAKCFQIRTISHIKSIYHLWIMLRCEGKLNVTIFIISQS